MIILSLSSGLSDHGAMIISAIIQAAGAIAAALIAAVYAKRIVKSFRFHSYSDSPENIVKILKKARSDIFIITVVGDKLLSASEKEIARCLRRGIRVRYLLLDPVRFHEMESYMHGKNAKEIQIFYNAIKSLSRLQNEYPSLLEVRFFSSHMTASYICIDSCPDPSRDAALFSPFVQIMLYQYHVHAKKSILLTLHEKTDQDHYDATIRSMQDMWEDAVLRLKEYREPEGTSQAAVSSKSQG